MDLSQLSSGYESLREKLAGGAGKAAVAAGVTVAALAGAYYYLQRRSRRAAIHAHHDLACQSVEIEPGVRASCLAKDGKLVESLYEDSTTLYECFLRGTRLSAKKPYLGWRVGDGDYQWITYQEAFERAQLLGSALVEKGLMPGGEGFVGIFSQNRPEWMLVEHACSMFSLVTVPLYDTLGKDACAYIISQTEMRLVVCDKATKAANLLQCADNIPSLKIIVVIDDITEEVINAARDRQVELLSLSDLEELGRSCRKEAIPPQPDDLCTICYTSGTTGNPKGVMLTHKNLISNVAAVVMVAEINVEVTDIHMSYLPLAHMFERACSVLVYQCGARIGYFRGDVKLLTEDMAALQPTVFPTVPRLLNRIYDKVLAGANKSAVKGALFRLALGKKQKLLKCGRMSHTTIWDRLVFRKIHALLGGRVKYMITGAAPLSATVMSFAKCALGCVVMEGYGQTEATAGVTFTFADENEPGHVGAPLPCNYVKLADVPEMDIFASQNKGEVCVKGNNVMKGYFKEEAKTREAIDSDGWLHTGDIGIWLPNGTLKIVDRRKHIFKLAQGEYIAPEKIENIYIQSGLVAQAFVDGNSLQAFLLAVIVPDLEVLPKWAESVGLSGSIEDICNHPVLKKSIFDDIIAIGKKAGLHSFEQVKDIFIHHEMFTPENGLLTPTFKSKRPVLRSYFEKQFETMYSNLN